MAFMFEAFTARIAGGLIWHQPLEQDLAIVAL